MADSKISALPASTTPLAGTEVLPIVQSSTTKQVSVANLTTGRAISATQLTLTTGNLIVASGQGIDFSATSGTGTSELLADYEEGTWTPGFAGWTGAPTFSDARYIKIGSQVTVIMLGQNGINAGNEAITGLPFANSNAVCPTGALKVFGSSSLSSLCNVDTSASSINSFSAVTLTGNYWSLSVTYFVTF